MANSSLVKFILYVEDFYHKNLNISMAVRYVIIVLEQCFEVTRMAVKSLSPNPQNGQTHSNNSSAKADELFECV